MGDVFENLERSDQLIIEIGSGLPEDQLVKIEGGTGLYDPHVWFNVLLWKDAA